MSKCLFIVDGAAGTGKTDLIEYVESNLRNAGVLKKLTSRPMRDEERRHGTTSDLIFLSQAEFDAMRLDYAYEYRGYSYGFSKQDLTSLLSKYDQAFVIIRSIPVIRRLAEATESHDVIKVYVHSDPCKTSQRLKAQGYTDNQIQFRLSRIEDTYREYILNKSFYDELLFNKSEKSDYHRLIDNLVMKYSQPQ